MVAVRLAVSSTVDELSSVTVRDEAGLQAGDEILATIEGVFEGDGPGDWPVIEE